MLFWKVSFWFSYTFIHTHNSHLCMYVQPLSCVWHFATLWSVACQACLSMGFFQARILKWVAISFSRGSSWYRDGTCFSCVSCIVRQILCHFTTEPSTIKFIMLPSSYKTIFRYHSHCFYYGNIKTFMVRHEVRLIFFSNALWFSLEQIISYFLLLLYFLCIYE